MSMASLAPEDQQPAPNWAHLNGLQSMALATSTLAMLETAWSGWSQPRREKSRSPPATARATSAIAGPASAIVAGGTFVDLGAGAILDAQANGTGGKAGAITVATSDIGQRLISAPVDYTNKNANIVIDGATIEGGSVTISATASDTVSSSAPSRRAWVVARLARSEPLSPVGNPR